MRRPSTAPATRSTTSSSATALPIISIGAAGNDSLDGGTGADTLDGGSGNDTYTIDNVGDVITELAGGGTDTAQSSVSYTLSAEVENLTLTGSSAINGTGNTLANVIVGNSGANILDGGVDAVSDSLSGGAGNDTINIRTADTADAGTGDDVLVLFDNTGFGTITGGTNTTNDLAGREPRRHSSPSTARST